MSHRRDLIAFGLFAKLYCEPYSGAYFYVFISLFLSFLRMQPPNRRSKHPLQAERRLALKFGHNQAHYSSQHTCFSDVCTVIDSFFDSDDALMLVFMVELAKLATELRSDVRLCPSHHSST